MKTRFTFRKENENESIYSTEPDKKHNEKLHNIYISPSIIWMISWRMYWVGHFQA
jgi:hypothetical protein